MFSLLDPITLCPHCRSCRRAEENVGVERPRCAGVGLTFGNLDGVEPIEPGVYLVTDWASGPLFRVDAQGNVVRLLDLHPGTADLTFLPETKTILIPMMLDNSLVAYKLE